MAGEKLARWLNEAKGNPNEMADVVFGQVMSVKPLQVMVESRFLIDERFLVVSETLKKKEVSFTVPTYTVRTSEIPILPIRDNKVDVDATIQKRQMPTDIEKSTQTITIEIFKDLKVGEKVSMIRGHSGQMYYLIDRK